MVEIKQNSITDRLRISKVIKESKKSDVHLDTDMLIKDKKELDKKIEKIKKEIHAKNDKARLGALEIDLINLQNIKRYLNELERIMRNNNWHVKLKWMADSDNRILCSPVTLRNFPNYKVNVMDYVITGKEKIMTVDLREVLDLLTLELVFLDIGIDFDIIEEKLRGISQFRINSVDVLKDADVYEEGLYELAKTMRIERSHYLTDKGITSYFGELSKNKEKTYRKAVENTSKDVIAQYVYSMIKNSNNIELLSVGETDICFKTNEDDIELIAGNVGVVVFGRKFEVKPIIKVYEYNLKEE